MNFFYFLDTAGFLLGGALFRIYQKNLVLFLLINVAVFGSIFLLVHLWRSRGDFLLEKRDHPRAFHGVSFFVTLGLFVFFWFVALPHMY